MNTFTVVFSTKLTIKTTDFSQRKHISFLSILLDYGLILYHFAYPNDVIQTGAQNVLFGRIEVSKLIVKSCFVLSSFLPFFLLVLEPGGLILSPSLFLKWQAKMDVTGGSRHCQFATIREEGQVAAVEWGSRDKSTLFLFWVTPPAGSTNR
jgi:hypothetical protein